MKGKIQKIIVMLIIFIFFNVYLNIDSNAANIISINKISDFNQKEEINSHENDTQTSQLEPNYRERVKLIKGENLNYDVPLQSNEVTQKEDHMGYPRLKKLSKETIDGYKYILTFQNSTSNNDAGINVYYTRSKDLKNWDKPQILFEGVQKSTGQEGEKYCYFTSCDTYVLNDGTIIAVSAKYRGYYGDFTTRALNDQGLYMRISKDNGNTWEETKKIYTGRCWEPTILQLSTGEIHIYFTLTSDTVYVRGADSHSSGSALISSIDNGNTWTPNVRGTNQEFDEKNYDGINPYSAYRIFQTRVRAKNTRRNS